MENNPSAQEQKSTKKVLRIIEFLMVSFFPISVIKFGLKQSLLHYVILCLVAVYASGVIFYRKWTWGDIGFRFDTLVHWKKYAIITIAATLFIVWLHDFLGMKYVVWTPIGLAQLVPISLLLSFIQEFLYRGYLFRLFKDITNHSWMIVIPNIVVFSYMHVIFPNWQVIIPLTAGGGILFAVLYHKYPNIFLVSAMHVVLNFTVLYLGFFPVALLHV